MHEGNYTDRANLNSTYGALLFGVPNQGMDISSLIPMVKDQPNRHFLETLGRESDLLRKQNRAFPKAFPFKDSEIYCFYETLGSPTAIEVSLPAYHPEEY
jgi:protein SERAC1